MLQLLLAVYALVTKDFFSTCFAFPLVGYIRRHLDTNI
jgi:hypothetical protein